MGATGMLGHVLVDRLKDDYPVHATVRRRPPDGAINLDPELLHHLDACTWTTVERVLDEVRPHTIINAIGIVKQLPQASQSIPSIEVNALFPHLLERAADLSGARVIHISTDCVFRGRLPAPERYAETDEPDATDLYGMTKRLGEITGANALTLRTSIIGPELSGDAGLFGWLITQRGSSVRGFKNAVFSGLTTYALADVIVELLHPRLAQVSGMWHVASEPITKYDLLQRLNVELELDCTITAADVPRINRALDASRLQHELDIMPPGWDAMISDLRARQKP